MKNSYVLVVSSLLVRLVKNKIDCFTLSKYVFKILVVTRALGPLMKVLVK